MKKLLYLIVCLISVSTFAAPKNYIRNGNFTYLKYRGSIKIADGVLPDPWQVQGSISVFNKNCTVVKDIKPADYKGNSYRIVGATYLYQFTYQVTPGKVYDLSCKMKTDGIIAKAQPRFQIIWTDKNRREILKEYKDSKGRTQKMWDHEWTFTASNHDWKEFTIKGFKAPPDAVYGKIRIGKADAAGVVYYADLKMTESISQ